jgi:hypothetical protein
MRKESSSSTIREFHRDEFVCFFFLYKDMMFCMREEVQTLTLSFYAVNLENLPSNRWLLLLMRSIRSSNQCVTFSFHLKRKQVHYESKRKAYKRLGKINSYRFITNDTIRKTRHYRNRKEILSFFDK